MLASRRRSSSSVAFILAGSLLAIAPSGEALGAITFVQEEGRDEGYSGFSDVLVSPDGRFLYVADYYNSEIHIYSREPLVGKIEELDEVPGLPSVVALAMTADGHHIYGAGYYSNDVLVLERDATTGGLTLIQTANAVVGGVDYILRPQFLALSADEANLYITGLDSNSIGVFSRDLTTGLLTFVEAQVNGVNGVVGLEYPVGVAVSPNGASVYVAAGAAAAAGGDTLVAFTRDPGTGRLTYLETHHDGVGGESLRFGFHVSTSPDSANVYVTTGTGLRVYIRDSATGALGLVQTLNDSISHEFHLTADGTRGYGCGAAGYLRGYARNLPGGTLTLEESLLSQAYGFDAPSFCFGMTITSDGENMYTIDSYEDELPGIEYNYAIGVFRHLRSPCSSAPLAGCRSTKRPGAASLEYTLTPNHKQNSLRFRWSGEATSLAELGDPVDQPTDYSLCVFDSFGEEIAASAPAMSPCGGDFHEDEVPCWSSRKAGYAFRDAKARRDGLRVVRLRPSDRTAVLSVFGRGEHLRLPDSSLWGTVTAQLQASDGNGPGAPICWEATFSSPTVNYSGRYQAKSD